MKQQQGFGLIGLLVLLALVIVAGGGYTYSQKLGPFAQTSSTQTTASSTPTTPTTPTAKPTPTPHPVPVSSVPTATIDQSLLAPSTGGKDTMSVTITGSATNTDHVLVVIVGQASIFANVINGRWSATTQGFLNPNTYTIKILNENSRGNKEEVLTTGTLTIPVAGGSVSSTDLSINYFRLSSASTPSNPVAEWSVSNAAPNSCTLFKYSSNPPIVGSTPVTTSVAATGSLAVSNGYYYKLGCSGSHNGENATASESLDLISH